MSQRDASAILMDQVLRYDLGRLAAQVMRDIDENKEMRQVLLGSIVEAPPDALDVVGEMFFTTALDVQMERSIAVGWYWYIAGAITGLLQRKLDLFDSSKLFNPGVLSETSGLCSDEELRKAIMALGYGLCEARRCFDVILAAQLVIHAYGEPSCRGFIPSWPNAIEVVDYRADFEQIRPLADRAGAQELQKTYADFEQLLAGRSGEDYTRALRYYLGPRRRQLLVMQLRTNPDMTALELYHMMCQHMEGQAPPPRPNADPHSPSDWQDCGGILIPI